MNKYEEIARCLKDRIRSGAYIPGQKLPSEAELCREFSTSRLSVRGAIGQLSAQGLIQTHQGKGSFVCPGAPSGVTELSFQGASISRTDFFELRRILETEIAGLAAQRAGQETIDHLRELSFQMQRAERESEMAEADEAFHLLLAEASQNAAIRAVFQMLRPYIHTMMVQNVSVLGADGCTAHLKIVAAIEVRNSELAKTHMAEHLNRSMEQTNMLNYVKKLDAPAD